MCGPLCECFNDLGIHFHACFLVRDLTVDICSGHVALRLTGKGGVESDDDIIDHYHFAILPQGPTWLQKCTKFLRTFTNLCQADVL